LKTSNARSASWRQGKEKKARTYIEVRFLFTDQFCCIYSLYFKQHRIVWHFLGTNDVFLNHSERQNALYDYRLLENYAPRN